MLDAKKMAVERVGYIRVDALAKSENPSLPVQGACEVPNDTHDDNDQDDFLGG